MAVFDLDKTIVIDNCSFDFCRYLVEKRVFPYSFLFYSLLYYFKHLLLGSSLADLHNKIFGRLLQGKSLAVLEEHVVPFLQAYLQRKFYPPALAQLKQAQRLGYYTLILSNSPSFLVKKIAEFLGVNEWRATEYAVDAEGNLCHITSIMQGEDKAFCVREIANKLSIAKEQIIAYSDSILDLPFLLSAGTPVAVNPDRKLRCFSLSQGWRIL
jgi:HAD superfamily hydrolase (TIGR01490 family)